MDALLTLQPGGLVSDEMRSRVLSDLPIHIRFKLSALWASVTLCYLYCDFFELYQPGKLATMLDGRMGPLGPSTQGVLLGVSVVLSIPAIMVALSLVLPPAVCRWLNVVTGTIFTLIMLVLVPRVWHFYQYFAMVEMVITGSIVWLAWRWPVAGDGVRPAVAATH